MSTILRARAHRNAGRRLQEAHVAEANKIRRELPDENAPKDLTIVVRKQLRETYPDEFLVLYNEELEKLGLAPRERAHADST